MKSNSTADLANRSLGNQLFDDATVNKNALISDIIEPVLLIAGILSNLVLIAIIFKKKKTESFRSHKPLRYLLIVILISDIAYLISELNVKIVQFGTWPDLTSFNYFCQLHSYLYYFFAVLIEFSMLSANYIVACLIHLPKKQSKSSIDVYNDFIINENDATNLRGGNFRTRSIRRLRGLFVRSNSEPIEKMPGRPGSVDNLESQNLSRGSGCNTGRHGNRKRASLGANANAKMAKNVNMEAVQRHENVTAENETGRSTCNDGGQSLLNNRISLINEINRRERLNQYRANVNSLVYPLKIEEDDTYFSLALKEKFFIILSIFVCMYFLSFFLWIQGVENLEGGLGSMNPEDFLANKGQPASNKSDFDKELDELLAESQHSFTSQNLPIPFSRDLMQVCKTHKFAYTFLHYFLLFLFLLRLVTLCINLVMTVCFCVRFKADLIQALCSSFKKRDDSFYSKSKLINFKSFKFTLITDCEQPAANGGEPSEKKGLARRASQLVPSDSSRQVSHVDMECGTTNDMDSNGGNSHSDSSNARANAYKRFKRDRHKLLARHHQKMYYSHLHFVRHHITTIAFYSILISFGVISEINRLYLYLGASSSAGTDFGAPSPYSSDNFLNSSASSSLSFSMRRARMNTTVVASMPTTVPRLVKTTAATADTTRLPLKPKSVIQKFMDIESDMKVSVNIQTLINLTTILAHSSKLLIYLVFSAHIKCFVKLNRPRARNNQIRDDV